MKSCWSPWLCGALCSIRQNVKLLICFPTHAKLFISLTPAQQRTHKGKQLATVAEHLVSKEPVISLCRFAQQQRKCNN